MQVELTGRWDKAGLEGAFKVGIARRSGAGVRRKLGSAEGAGGGVGAIRVEVAVEGIHGSFQNQAAVGAGFKVAPDFGLNRRGEATF